jgi:hypothetical protein
VRELWREGKLVWGRLGLEVPFYRERGRVEKAAMGGYRWQLMALKPLMARGVKEVGINAGIQSGGLKR